ncbi:hypothetical protein A3B57_01790 [Microgenomates group bacterium RIFCSPLOWO2_01_FULL_47_10]|nr:MAG: hypothetical protein A3B57_01790 [Microgenomates group bacterium RIFCSPLOWO2_01_FULL_47_10]
MKSPAISVVINTKNSALTLERTLKSVAWADDIVVCDMASTDETVKIARKFTDRIFSVDDRGYVEPARNFATAKAKHEWILVLDADEEVPIPLAEELETIINSGYDVIDIPRKNIIFGRWLEHAGWWPDYQRRIFRKNFVVWSDTIHSKPAVKGKIKILPPEEKYALIHQNYQTIEQYLDRLNRYTSIEAKHLSGAVTSQAKIIETGFSELFNRFFKEQGFKGNLHGLSVSFLQMFYQIVTQLKIWQAQEFKSASGTINQIFPSIISQMKYWYADYRSKTTKNPLMKLYWLVRKHFKI